MTELPATDPLAEKGDLAELMVAGIQRYLLRATRKTAAASGTTAQKRQRLARLIGADGPRATPELSYIAAKPLARGSNYHIHAVRWRVFARVDAEGLLLEPRRPARATVVALPDADWTPERIAGLEGAHPAYAARLARSGCRVLVPTLIDRACTHSGLPGVRMTNQPHREYLYRAAFELGQHLIGIEVQKILAAIDLYDTPVGVCGYGEGGLLALYAAALDQRIAAAGVSGYFQSRQALWREPIYRNIFGLLREFGDAEIAALVAGDLVVEASPHPRIAGPPAPSAGRAGAAPGCLITPAADQVASEFERAQALAGPHGRDFALVHSTAPGSDALLATLLIALGIQRLQPTGPAPRRLRNLPDASQRHKRQFHQLLDHTQDLLADAEFARKRFWARADARDADTWKKTTRRYRKYLHDQVIGRLPAPRVAPRPRSRLVYREKKYTGYEVVLDVYRDVFAYGILLVPKGIRKDQKLPVVVCQHGLEGRPQDLADAAVDHPAYHRYACRLAEMGYVVFAPQNPYIGQDQFRRLQRLANPLGLSLFSFIVRQHQRILQWLATLPYIDPARIAFYGLSYGGKTAMRVPALLEDYCLSICSADYNEWIWKNASARHSYSYLLTGEYEMCEFDLGNTFNYAEMSWLVCPRPFMVERGHHDGVAPDEWVAYEYARTYRRYVELGLTDRTAIEFFDGPHTINSQGTLRFLQQHLAWPPRRRN